jgi:hypothetical protein
VFTGLSNDSHRIASSTLDAAQSFLSVLSFPLPLDMEFAAKAQEWKSETEFCSSPEIAAGHPAYQRIIGMGPVVVPMILQEMRKEPGLWFDALMALTDEQPVLEAHAGDIVAMTQDWLEWGRRNGYLEG